MVHVARVLMPITAFHFRNATFVTLILLTYRNAGSGLIVSLLTTVHCSVGLTLTFFAPNGLLNCPDEERFSDGERVS